jgi:hypothetical protein
VGVWRGKRLVRRNSTRPDAADRRTHEPCLRRSGGSSNAGLIVTASTSATVHGDLITMLAARHRLPRSILSLLCHRRGAMSYGAIQQAVKLQLAINMKAAQALGL